VHWKNTLLSHITFFARCGWLDELAGTFSDHLTGRKVVARPKFKNVDKKNSKITGGVKVSAMSAYLS